LRFTVRERALCQQRSHVHQADAEQVSTALAYIDAPNLIAPVIGFDKCALACGDQLAPTLVMVKELFDE
jgi:hypothetical protein